MVYRLTRRGVTGGIGAALLAAGLAAAPVPAFAQSGEPIKIGRASCRERVFVGV